MIKGENYTEIINFNGKKFCYYNQIPNSLDGGNEIDILLDILKEDFMTIGFVPDKNNFVIINLNKEKNVHFEANWPVEQEFLVAYALAHNILTNKHETFNFVADSSKEKLSHFIWKRAFFNITLISGILMSIIYLVAFTFSWYMGMLNEKVINQRETLKPHISNLILIEQKKSIMIKDLMDARNVSKYKSATSLMLKSIAYHIPKECWLIEFVYDKDTDKEFNTILTGMSKNDKTVNQFLANLEGDKIFNMVKLDYIEQITKDEMFRKWKVRSEEFKIFQFSLKF